MLEVLYDEGTAPNVAGLFVRDVKGYIASLALALAVVKQSQSEKKTKVKMKKNVLRLHLTFLVDHMWGLLKDENSQEDEERHEKENKKGRELIFHQVIFPLLLFTKGRQKNVEVVWEILGELDSETLKDSGIGEGLALWWLHGCGGIVKAEGGVGEGVGKGGREEGKEAEVEWMNRVNFGVAGQIAGTNAFLPFVQQHGPDQISFSENIISSKTKHFALDLEILVSKMRDENVYVKLLAYVIVLVLLRKVEGGERKVEVGEKTLCALCLAGGENRIEGVGDLSQEHLALEVCLLLSFFNFLFSDFLLLNWQKEGDISFAKYIITKPQSRTSLRWIQTAVLAGIARIPLPVQGEELNWMLESAKVSVY